MRYCYCYDILECALTFYGFRRRTHENDYVLLVFRPTAIRAHSSVRSEASLTRGTGRRKLHTNAVIFRTEIYILPIRSLIVRNRCPVPEVSPPGTRVPRPRPCPLFKHDLWARSSAHDPARVICLYANRVCRTRKNVIHTTRTPTRTATRKTVPRGVAAAADAQSGALSEHINYAVESAGV